MHDQHASATAKTDVTQIRRDTSFGCRSGREKNGVDLHPQLGQGETRMLASQKTPRRYPK
jgi:hypothetical protein